MATEDTALEKRLHSKTRKWAGKAAKTVCFDSLNLSEQHSSLRGVSRTAYGKKGLDLLSDKVGQRVSLSPSQNTQNVLDYSFEALWLALTKEES